MTAFIYNKNETRSLEVLRAAGEDILSMTATVLLHRTSWVLSPALNRLFWE